MARILLSAEKNRPWSPGNLLEPSLRGTGHTIQCLDWASVVNPGEELLAFADRFKPHVNFVYGGAVFPPDVIERLGSNGVCNVLWYPDVTPSPLPEVVEAGRAYDVFFTMAEGLVERFAAAGIPDPQWLPEGMEPSVYEYDSLTDLDRKLFGCDVALVGRLESENPAYMERWKLVKRLADEGLNIKWWGPRIRRRIGTFVLGLLLSKVSRAYGGRFVWNETYAKAIHMSKVFIARDAYPRIRLSMSARAFVAMGVGAFYLTFPTQGIETMFEPDKELVTFLTPDDMIEKIRYYLDHEEERAAIAAAAREKVLGNHTYAHRIRAMLEVVEKRGVELSD
jgi:spore maturation protein CgeB